MNDQDTAEAIILRPSLISIFLKIALFELVVFFLTFGYYFLTSQIEDLLTGLIYVMDFFVQIFLVVQLIFVFIPVLQWFFTYQKLDKSGLVVKHGIFSKDTSSFPSLKVEAVNVEQGFLGRIFNYGTIHIKFREPPQEVDLVNISNPDRIVEFINPQQVTPAAIA